MASCTRQSVSADESCLPSPCALIRPPSLPLPPRLAAPRPGQCYLGAPVAAKLPPHLCCLAHPPPACLLARHAREQGKPRRVRARWAREPHVAQSSAWTMNRQTASLLRCRAVLAVHEQARESVCSVERVARLHVAACRHVEEKLSPKRCCTSSCCHLLSHTHHTPPNESVALTRALTLRDLPCVPSQLKRAVRSGQRSELAAFGRVSHAGERNSAASCPMTRSSPPKSPFLPVWLAGDVKR